jgi:pimeloyl-ACP methyl ester carboxylesterase
MNLKLGYAEYSVNLGAHHIHFLCRYAPDSHEVILFLYGLGCSLDSFRSTWEHDYFPGKSILILDLPGFGRSSKPEDFSYRMEDQAKVIEELLSQFPFWKIHIAAHSMGGAVGLLFSPEFFSRVLSFANIEGSLISEDCGLLSRSIAKVSFEEYRDNLYKEQVIKFRGHPHLRFEETTLVALYKSAASLVEWSDSGELLNKFRDLTCRKCYFYGEENKGMPVLEKLNFVTKVMIHNSGHSMMTENPTEFYIKLAEFIESK